MGLDFSVPHSWLYWEAGFAVWIGAQIATGKALYRSRLQSRPSRRQILFKRQEQPGIFWVIIAHQALPVLVMFCCSIGFIVGMYLSAALYIAFLFGTLTWGITSVIRQGRQKNGPQG